MGSTGTTIGTTGGLRIGGTTAKVVRGTTDATLYTFDTKQKAAIGALVDYTGKNFCTAALVGPNAVLTAAHCVQGIEDVASLRFVLGQNAASPEHTFEILEARVNPKWRGTAEHDNAILVLADRALSYATPLPINTEPLPSLVGKQVQNVGYGATEPNGSGHNTLRWWTPQPVTAQDGYVITVDGQNTSSVCKGDSGSPSIYRFPDGSLRVVGTLFGGESSCLGLDRFARVDPDALFLLSGGNLVSSRVYGPAATVPYLPRRPQLMAIGIGLGVFFAAALVGALVGKRQHTVGDMSKDVVLKYQASKARCLV